MTLDILDRPIARLAPAFTLLARAVFAGLFGMALWFKLTGFAMISGQIANAGFPMPDVLTVLAILFEAGLVAAFLTGLFFRTAAVLAGIYVVFLAFSFHGPALWAEAWWEFGFFVDHFALLAGLLLAAAIGPGPLAPRHAPPALRPLV